MRFLVAAFWTHGAYLVHYAMCEKYSVAVRERLRWCRVRVDYSRINPVLLEWIHDFETSSLLALCWPPAAIVSVYSLVVLCCIAAKWESRLASRRMSDLLVASMCLAPRSLVGPVQLHAWLVPSRRTPFLLHALSASLCVVGWSLAGAFLAFSARDVGHAYSRSDRMTKFDAEEPAYTGYAANYPVTSPTSLLLGDFFDREEEEEDDDEGDG